MRRKFPLNVHAALSEKVKSLFLLDDSAQISYFLIIINHLSCRLIQQSIKWFVCSIFFSWSLAINNSFFHLLWNSFSKRKILLYCSWIFFHFFWTEVVKSCGMPVRPNYFLCIRSNLNISALTDCLPFTLLLTLPHFLFVSILIAITLIISGYSFFPWALLTPLNLISHLLKVQQASLICRVFEADEIDWFWSSLFVVLLSIRFVSLFTVSTIRLLSFYYILL